MGRIILLISLLGLFFLPKIGRTQVPYVLGIDSIAGLPDTIINGQEYTFYVEMTNASPLVFQGDSEAVKLVFLYNGTDTIEADNTTLMSPFVAGAGTASLLEVRHAFTTDGGTSLGIGINVVVVWPRLNDGIDPPQEMAQPPYSRNLFLIEPNSVTEYRSSSSFSTFPNPSFGQFQVSVSGQQKIDLIRLLDLSGRVMQYWQSDDINTLKVNTELNGNFLLEVRFKDGSTGHQLLILR